MFTLIYNNNELNRPVTLLGFIQSNAGKSPLLQVDCITPFIGSEHDLVQKVCEHLNNVDHLYEVSFKKTHNCSIEQNSCALFVYYMVIQVDICALL